jgi:hypothetical protein
LLQDEGVEAFVILQKEYNNSRLKCLLQGRNGCTKKKQNMFGEVIKGVEND